MNRKSCEKYWCYFRIEDDTIGIDVIWQRQLLIFKEFGKKMFNFICNVQIRF